jgi:hypothetical protein
MKAAMLREWQTVNQGGLSSHEMHCHQYLAIGCRYLNENKISDGWRVSAESSPFSKLRRVWGTALSLYAELLAAI